MWAVFSFSHSKADSGSQIEKANRLKEQRTNIRNKPAGNFKCNLLKTSFTGKLCTFRTPTSRLLSWLLHILTFRRYACSSARPAAAANKPHEPSAGTALGGFGVTLFEGAEADPVPAAFVAVTVKQ